MKTILSHLDADGRARMVDVGGKPSTAREAVAFAEVKLSAGLLRLIREGRLPKGDVLSTARLAAILAAKKTGELIPLCHPLGLDLVEVSFLIERRRVVIRAEARSSGKTGVEMEALTAACVAGLTIYDMCKSADKGIVLGPVFLGRKSGGRSGLYRRAGVPLGWLPGPAGRGGAARWL